MLSNFEVNIQRRSVRAQEEQAEALQSIAESLKIIAENIAKKEVEEKENFIDIIRELYGRTKKEDIDSTRF